MKKISIIGAKQGWGARRSGCEDGPDKLKESGVESSLHACGVEVKWTSMLTSFSSARGLVPELKETLPHVFDMDERLYQKVRAELRHSKFPLVFGGDHSIAVGTWSAVVDELSAHEKFGLIWVDAHMDAHTPETCNEGAWGGYYHGQPLSALLGEGEDCFVNLGEKSPKLAPENVCLIGIRSFEPGEKAFLERHNVRVFYMEEIHERGLDAVMKEALEIATNGTKAFGMTIDLDGFDPEDAPGVGTNEPDGLRREEFCDAIRGLAARYPTFKALEITEYNPHRGKGGKTIHLVKELLLNLFQK